MIRITRSMPEPPALTAKRQAELQRIRSLIAMMGRDPTSDEVGTTYKVAHGTLWQMQGYKCAYCESREQSRRNDVEHFRPKARANRDPGSPARHGYWWLAWTWENLLFSCRNCNQSPAKLDKFPLQATSVALVAEQAPPGLEIPLLIDPTAEDPRTHIEFVRRAGPAGDRWMPLPRGGSAKGGATIRVCLLDRPELLDLYDQHVTLNVTPEVTRLEAAITTGDAAAVTAAWAMTRARLLHQSQVFVGLTCDALSALVPGLQSFGITPAPWG